MSPDPAAPDRSLPALTAAAARHLAAQPWVSRVHGITPVFAVAGELGVFRCAVIPSCPDADVMVWVVTGELPTAHVAHEPGDSWQDALHAYVTALGRWVDAVRAGSPLVGGVALDLPPTRDEAERLAMRLEALRTRLVEVDPATVANDA